MTYLALAAGARGIVYRGDAELTRGTGAGRALLIEMGFLNFEMDLCEQILAQNEEKIRDYGVFDPEPLPVPSNAIQLREPEADSGQGAEPAVGHAGRGNSAAATSKGALVLVGDFAAGSQFQPPQLAADELTVTLALPEGAAGVRDYSRRGQGAGARARGDRNAAHAQGIRHHQPHLLHQRPQHVRSASRWSSKAFDPWRSLWRSSKRRSCFRR